jgi:hypothetical protein
MKLSRTKIDRNLSAAQRNMLCDWLLERAAHPTGTLVEMGLHELGLWEEACEPSANSIAEWLKKSLTFEVARRDLARANEAAGVLASAGKANMDDANQALVQSMVLESLMAAREARATSGDGAPAPDFSDLVDAVINLGHLRVKERALEQGEKKLAQEATKIAQGERRISVEEHKVDIMQVKAAEAVLAKSNEIVAIASDAGLSSQQKVDAARRVLFGDAHVDAGKGVAA